jgi:hypothetical protein
MQAFVNVNEMASKIEKSARKTGLIGVTRIRL